jgi:hypothetical protein
MVNMIEALQELQLTIDWASIPVEPWDVEPWVALGVNSLGEPVMVPKDSFEGYASTMTVTDSELALEYIAEELALSVTCA